MKNQYTFSKTFQFCSFVFVLTGITLVLKHICNTFEDNHALLSNWFEIVETKQIQDQVSVYQDFQEFVQNSNALNEEYITDPFPLVSIITVTYNRGRYLEQAILSVLNQTYQNWELHVVDDGSHKPEAIAVLEKYSNFDPRIHVHLLGTNYGDSQFGRNYGISKSEGQFIAIIDDDDIMFPTRIQAQVEHMNKNPYIDVLGGRMLMINESDSVYATYFSKPMKHEEIKFRLLFMNYIGHSTIMFRFNDKNKAKIYYRYVSAEDYDHWLRLLYDEQMTFEIMDEFMVYYRTHSAAARKEENVNRSNLHWIHTEQYRLFAKSYSFIYEDYYQFDYHEMHCLMYGRLDKCLKDRKRFIKNLMNFLQYYQIIEDYKMQKVIKETILHISTLSDQELLHPSVQIITSGNKFKKSFNSYDIEINEEDIEIYSGFINKIKKQQEPITLIQDIVKEITQNEYQRNYNIAQEQINYYSQSNNSSINQKIINNQTPQMTEKNSQNANQVQQNHQNQQENKEINVKSDKKLEKLRQAQQLLKQLKTQINQFEDKGKAKVANKQQELKL
eukprot:403355407